MIRLSMEPMNHAIFFFNSALKSWNAQVAGGATGYLRLVLIFLLSFLKRTTVAATPRDLKHS
jgi:hypothetical protein